MGAWHVPQPAAGAAPWPKLRQQRRWGSPGGRGGAPAAAGPISTPAALLHTPRRRQARATARPPSPPERSATSLGCWKGDASGGAAAAGCRCCLQPPTGQGCSICRRWCFAARAMFPPSPGQIASSQSKAFQKEGPCSTGQGGRRCTPEGTQHVTRTRQSGSRQKILGPAESLQHDMASQEQQHAVMSCLPPSPSNKSRQQKPADQQKIPGDAAGLQVALHPS